MNMVRPDNLRTRCTSTSASPARTPKPAAAPRMSRKLQRRGAPPRWCGAWTMSFRNRGMVRFRRPPRTQETVVTFLYVALGTLAGVLAGLFGIGGGVIMVIGMVGLMKLPFPMAVGTSLGDRKSVV